MYQTLQRVHAGLSVQTIALDQSALVRIVLERL